MPTITGTYYVESNLLFLKCEEDIKCLSSKKDITFWFLTSDYAKEQWEKITEILKGETDPDKFIKMGRINEMQEESLRVFFNVDKMCIWNWELGISNSKFPMPFKYHQNI